jgi:hypothetical protein
MRQVPKRLALILCAALVTAGVLAVQPALAGKKNIVKGEIVSFDAEANKLVVKVEGSSDEVTFITTPRTGVIGLRLGTEQNDVSVLVGRQGARVVVKFKNGGNGKEATFIRIKSANG